MSKIIIVNVVHCEPNWWDDSYSGLDIGTQKFLNEIKIIEKQFNKKVPITWCVHFPNGNEKCSITGNLRKDTINERKEFFINRYKLGDEIGIHTHAADRYDEYWMYIEKNVNKLKEEGFPQPKTLAAFWNRVDKNVLLAMEKSNLKIDTSVSPRQENVDKDPSNISSFQPYHPSYDDVTKTGDSKIIELPMCFAYNGIDENPQWFIDEINNYIKQKNEYPINIIQFFWHPWEFMIPNTVDNINKPVYDGFIKFFKAMIENKDIYFDTTSNAIEEWQKNNFSK